jgi:hypothetical protein
MMMVSSGMPGPVTDVPGVGKTFGVFTARVGLFAVVAAVKLACAVDDVVGAWDSVTKFLDVLATTVPSGIPGPETGVPTMGTTVADVSVTTLLFVMM